MTSPRVRVGTSGWHYPSAGGWNGLFYPKPRPRGFDELAYYSQFFDTVEINSTFYGQPRAGVTQTWAERTPAEFQFSAKLYQKFTHPRMFGERVKRDVTRQLGTSEISDDAIVALIEANASDIDEFKRGIEPLANSHKLGPLLAQFPASFHDHAVARAHLAAVLRAFGDYSIAVELRHKTWSDNRESTLALLRAFGATWVWIDEPKFKDSIQQNLAATDLPFSYMRLHGRNAQQWWRHARPEDRYDYLYSADELAPIADAAKEANWRGQSAYLYTNNHKNAQAVINAAQLQELLGQRVPADLPEGVAVSRRK